MIANLTRALRLALVLLGLLPQSALALNTSNQDIDLFLNNPAIAAIRPNVLIVWDNTANWGQQINGNTAYSFEQTALNTVLGTLDDSYNLGLMMFTESAPGNSGAYMRFAVRQMNADNKTALTNLIGGLGQATDRGSNARYAYAMYEAYQYFKGIAAYAGTSGGAAKRDFPLNAQNPIAGARPGNAFTSVADTTYESPITAECQKNIVIFISNGGVDSGENNGAEAVLSGLGGRVGSDPIPLSPSSEQSNWADEFARFLATTDVSGLDGTQSIRTYTINVFDPARINQNPVASHIALMKSMAFQGKGKYFAAHDANSLVAALQQIFTEVQAINSVFSSTTLPVSVNVRGTNLNQVYIGVFRPDANLAPRWYGNLKMFTLGYDTNTGSLFLKDKNNAPAENPATGFLTATALSHWTSASAYWGFRPSDENGAGGASDSPDGDLVEKGAVAQHLRTDYALSQATRKLYTCTGTCAANSSLSATPFADGNANVTAAALGAADATERTAIINWVRGQDNINDENANGSLTDIRASVHGDVLHSRPAVVNYNRNNDDNDVIAYYGANDGVFRAIQGGDAAGAGTELWGFVPSETFGTLKRLRDNTPTISVASTKPYFMDGSVTIYQKDVNNDRKYVAADGDKVYLYIAARRGGRFIYALDVSDPADPRLLWKITNASTGFSELAQTWSAPIFARVRANANPVVIFGAGYDAAAEDTMPAGTVTKGRGVFVVDAFTGAMIWQAGNSPVGGPVNLSVSGMNYSIAADAAVLDRNGDGYADRIYLADTGANVWRADINDANPSNWAVHHFARLRSTSQRKFLYGPDVVYSKDGNGPYDAVLIGSGDREHPFDTTVQNRFFMLKDRYTGLSGAGQALITRSDLFDATSNVIQTGDAGAQATANAALLAAKGFYINLSTGEKVIGSAVTIAGTSFFNTNVPASVIGYSACGSNLGESRQYGIDYKTGIATAFADVGGGTPSRYMVHGGGGFLPSPVPVVVNIGGKVVQGVISGTSVQTPPAANLNQRYRVFWQYRHD